MKVLARENFGGRISIKISLNNVKHVVKRVFPSNPIDYVMYPLI